MTLLLLLALQACSDSPPVDPNDRDGDGHAAGQDCNDGDPTIHPGAVDGAYDGVDRDCDGTPERDLDGDGYDTDLSGGDDCNDADASIHPGAAEVWYDALDQDCSGTSDYDADGDGADALAWGGTDCDDADPEVQQSEAPWYLDGDGDGFGDPTRPTRCPVDGVHVEDATDCDDGAAGAFPGNAETFYDGVDGDCLGGSDFDADGDGLDSLGPDGPDCDDADPEVGALTWYRDADGDGRGDATWPLVTCTRPAGFVGDLKDCDDASAATGAPWCDTLDLAAADAHITPYTLGSAAGATLAAADLTGDGVIDLLVGAPLESSRRDDAGAAFVAEGPWRSLWALTDAWARLEGEGVADLAGTSVAAGDLDGDGAADALVGAPDGGTGGVVWLVLGPITGRVRLEDSASTLTSAQPGQRAGATAVFLGDVDGDGTGDVAVGNPMGDPADLQSGEVYVLEGPPGAGEVDLSSLATGRIEGEAVFNEWGATLAAIGDQNGDGLDDLALGSVRYGSGSGLVAVFEGPVVGVYGVSDADSQLSPAASGVGLGPVAWAGDVNADGKDDVLVGAPGDDTAHVDAGAAWLIEGPLVTSTVSAFARASLLGRDEGDLAGSALGSAADMDGSGRVDVWVGAPGASVDGRVRGAVHVVRSPVSGTVDLSASDLRLVDTGVEGTVGHAALGPGDLDGDGLGDLVIGSTATDRAGYLVLGLP